MEITSELTPEGIAKVKVGQILMFRDGDKRTDLKITRKAKGRVFAKEVTTYSKDEVNIEDVS